MNLIFLIDLYGYVNVSVSDIILISVQVSELFKAAGFTVSTVSAEVLVNLDICMARQGYLS